jgi:hypothetical protein
MVSRLERHVFSSANKYKASMWAISVKWNYTQKVAAAISTGINVMNWNAVSG